MNMMTLFCLKCSASCTDGEFASIGRGNDDWDKEKYQQFLFDVLRIRVPMAGSDQYAAAGSASKQALARKKKTKIVVIPLDDKGQTQKSGQGVVEKIVPDLLPAPAAVAQDSNAEKSTEAAVNVKDEAKVQAITQNGVDRAATAEGEIVEIKQEPEPEPIDEFPFCSRCRQEVETLFQLHEDMNIITRRFEETRDNLAAGLVDSFFQHCETMDIEPGVKGRMKSSQDVYERWKRRYTGKEDEEFRLKYLLEDKEMEVKERERRLQRMREENADLRSGVRPYGLSAMQLAKIQRAMTVSYFTPKMNVIRKRNRLYFRVGVKPKNPGIRHICKICSKEFQRLDTLNVHKRIHLIGLRKARRARLLRRSRDSLRKQQQQEEGTPNSNKPFTCEYCDIGFIESKLFETHMMKHTGKLPYKCINCVDDEGFKDSRDLRKHRIEAHPELLKDKSLACELCWNTYPTKEILKDHITKAHERYKCHFCNRVFKLGDHLKRHLYIHTGEKPYQCARCPKSFNQESNLKEHLYRHTGIRPHKCPHCDVKGYLRRNALKEHMMKEHGTDMIPTLPMGRAAQNARKAGQHPVPDPDLADEEEIMPVGGGGPATPIKASTTVVTPTGEMVVAGTSTATAKAATPIPKKPILFRQQQQGQGQGQKAIPPLIVRSVEEFAAAQGHPAPIFVKTGLISSTGENIAFQVDNNGGGIETTATAAAVNVVKTESSPAATFDLTNPDQQYIIYL